jgi:hypothetical protein
MKVGGAERQMIEFIGLNADQNFVGQEITKQKDESLS